MLIRIKPTTLLEIYNENLLYFQVIFKSMKIADDTFLGNSECEWLLKGMDHREVVSLTCCASSRVETDWKLAAMSSAREPISQINSRFPS